MKQKMSERQIQKDRYKKTDVEIVIQNRETKKGKIKTKDKDIERERENKNVTI